MGGKAVWVWVSKGMGEGMWVRVRVWVWLVLEVVVVAAVIAAAACIRKMYVVNSQCFKCQSHVQRVCSLLPRTTSACSALMPRYAPMYRFSFESRIPL